MTDHIISRIQRRAEKEKTEILFIEVGGTVGDLENEIFISKLKGNTGNFKFEIPKKINVSNYFKFVFFDEKNDLNLAFFIIKEVLE